MINYLPRNDNIKSRSAQDLLAIYYISKSGLPAADIFPAKSK